MNLLLLGLQCPFLQALLLGVSLAAHFMSCKGENRFVMAPESCSLDAALGSCWRHWFA